MKQEKIKKSVRDRYGKIAKKAGSCCLPSASCCGGENTVKKIGKGIGYSTEDLKSVPEGANLGLGCGNPIALASLHEGETVVDLGSGAGIDCFLAAKQVGKNGQVIGVDMTPEMLDKARENARKDGYQNVEFRLGEIENLPVADNIADIIISNCVINLAPDKERVFREAFRVLNSDTGQWDTYNPPRRVPGELGNLQLQIEYVRHHTTDAAPWRLLVPVAQPLW